MKAVVVLSGGQDSALCLALACRRFGAAEVAAITFSYGQRHAVELRYARKLARELPRRLSVPRPVACDRILHKIVDLGFYSQITASELLGNTASDSKRTTARTSQPSTLNSQHSTSQHSTLNSQPAQPPPTVVEGRNAIFLQIAAVWAKSLGAEYVYTGVSETDYSGYPDCRAAFIRAQQRALRLALEYPVRIVTPFMHKTKAEEWALADRLGILDYINRNTVTCYNGVPGAGCGKCDSCRLRNAGLERYLRGVQRCFLI